MRTKSFWLYLFLTLAGIVVGGLVAEITAGIPALSWLSYGQGFGTEGPVVLNLTVLSLTFGIYVKITVSTVIFVALSLLLGRLVTRN
ncbi:MAG: DUF4321 domain-containing protein [Clostridiales bacterium]|jgi:hypothetical protein|nr:DUF4321 domain-containing protein [Clostridiales bacterium]